MRGPADATRVAHSIRASVLALRRSDNSHQQKELGKRPANFEGRDLWLASHETAVRPSLSEL